MAEKVQDPVCGMKIDKNQAVPLERDGKTHYFCSDKCKNAFQKGKMPKEHEKHAGHDHASHHAHMVQDFEKRLWISLVATVPVLALSPMIQGLLNISFTFAGDRYLLFAISSFIYLYGGWPFLKGLVDEVKKARPGMMTLIAVAITVAYVYSGLVVFGLRGRVFFWELATLIDIMLLGHWIEMRSVMGASKALEELAKLMPKEAHRLQENGSTEDVPLEELHKDDEVLVKPGEKIPVDGQITDGESEIDESAITGESKPVSKSPGDSVIGGSVNGTGSLTVQVSKTGEDSYLSQVVNLVRQAGESKSRAQGLADKAAFGLTLIAITAGLITLTVWLALGKEFVFALERMVTVMVITCPHALGLAIPLVVAMITALSARNGLLIRNRTSFESARKLNVVVFDKTGTLTKGQFGVSDVVSFGDWNEDQLLRTAASIEQNSEHTIARGIVGKAQEKGLELTQARDFDSIPGKGAKANLDGQEIYLGNKGILEPAGVKDTAVLERVNQMASQGKTIVLVAADKEVQGLIGLADIIRDESREAIKSLEVLGLEISMITGDNEATARYVAEELGLDSYFAEVLPDKKSEKIKQLQQQGKKVAMVGDGVNDAPALAQADVGIAIGAGTDVAVETADVVLVENDPRDVADIVSLSQITNRKMKQNLAWATGYNVIAIPLAAGVLFSIGIVMPPAGGALVMSLSTVIVAINARRISYKKSRRTA
ncbi:MAG: heavy metal translocating P-type ATPase [Sedimentisphaerales bacterium]|nr:heavy metal translocating P-type ATPase [Sedimentisphaerales bacterium]